MGGGGEGEGGDAGGSGGADAEESTAIDGGRGVTGAARLEGVAVVVGVGGAASQQAGGDEVERDGIVGQVDIGRCVVDDQAHRRSVGTAHRVHHGAVGVAHEDVAVGGDVMLAVDETHSHTGIVERLAARLNGPWQVAAGSVAVEAGDGGAQGDTAQGREVGARTAPGAGDLHVVGDTPGDRGVVAG